MFKDMNKRYAPIYSEILLLTVSTLQQTTLIWLHLEFLIVQFNGWFNWSVLYVKLRRRHYNISQDSAAHIAVHTYTQTITRDVVSAPFEITSTES